MAFYEAIEERVKNLIESEFKRLLYSDRLNDRQKAWLVIFRYV